jgi:hypothetical protein
MPSSRLLQTPQEFFATPGRLSDAGRYAPLLEALPDDIDELCGIVQGLIIHVFWASRYGITLSEERQAEVGIRGMPAKLERLLALDDSPLNVERPLDKKLVGNCRDISLFLTSILQHKGIPARARCGFGTYFLPDHYEDHWMCEYWHTDRQRWVQVDAQLDAFQQEKLHIQFDPHDMPAGAFVTAGWGWQMCRAGQADPHKFGIHDMHGLWFVGGNVIRDFLALNKLEILPWDDWGYVHYLDIPAQDLPALDHIAGLSLSTDAEFGKVRELFQNDPRLQPAADWKP